MAIVIGALIGLSVLLPHPATAHGSVSAEEDLCAIKIGYFKAHFKIYVPEESGRDDYCEDIPAVGASIFVMEYLHSGLGEIPIDFRIIRDVTGMGTFARWEDVQAIDDLEAVSYTHLTLPTTCRVCCCGWWGGHC